MNIGKKLCLKLDFRLLEQFSVFLCIYVNIITSVTISYTVS